MQYFKLRVLYVNNRNEPIWKLFKNLRILNEYRNKILNWTKINDRKCKTISLFIIIIIKVDWLGLEKVKPHYGVYFSFQLLWGKMYGQNVH